MKRLASITRGGQISLPAEVRRRWATERVALQDEGDHLIIRPVPADPIAALVGRFPLPAGVTVDGLREKFRLEEGEADERKAREYRYSNELRIAE